MRKATKESREREKESEKKANHKRCDARNVVGSEQGSVVVVVVDEQSDQQEAGERRWRATTRSVLGRMRCGIAIRGRSSPSSDAPRIFADFLC